MPNLNIVRLFQFSRDALAGLGILYLMHLTGIANMNVTSMHISSAQAEYVAEEVFNGKHMGIGTGKGGKK